ncbi:hypothetical protein O181_067889 [Austropuccinia psidii MF-1]|uniref:Uncharacterized protein n=1 Tax=Austropuccinia psidii MF-1 TaxID=1389203 RepID=A0A9Q3I712_9BASI|nr:hypothetical protein [Austropuccinia psidii MF-1]
MGDPFFNLFTVSSSFSGESTPLAAASPSSPVFLASTSPTSPSISPPGSPLSTFATALMISPQSTNSDGTLYGINICPRSSSTLPQTDP